MVCSAFEKASLPTMHILCSGPRDLQPQLNAVMIDQLNYNILTQEGFEILRGIEFHPQQKEKTLTDRSGFAFVVKDVVEMLIWRDGDTKSETHMFYVLRSDDTLRKLQLHQRHLHAILSPKCFQENNQDRNSDRIAVLRVAKSTDDEKKKEKEVEEQRRKDAEDEKRKRRERESAPAQQKSR